MKIFIKGVLRIKKKFCIFVCMKERNFNEISTMADKAQFYADKFTSEIMSERFGQRFTECKNLEEDDELNRWWESLNEEFYEMIVPLL